MLEIYSEGNITLSKAANLLNMKIDDFLLEFHKRHLKHMESPETVGEVREEFEVAQKLKKDKIV